MNFTISVRHLVAVVLGVVFSASPAGATTILESQQLPELVDQSERAVLARVVSVDFRYHDNHLPSTFVTLEVEDAIYGEGLPRALQIASG